MSSLQTILEDFPLDFPLAMELGVLRAAAAPEIGSIFLKSGKYTNASNQRHSSAVGIVHILLPHANNPAALQQILRGINDVHAKHQIPKEYILYSLALMACEPIRWIDKYGWRKLTECEKQALASFWFRVALAMEIKGPPILTAEWFACEAKLGNQLSYPHPHNEIFAKVARRIFAARFPWWLSPVAKTIFDSLLGDRLRGQLGVPKPVWIFRVGTKAAFKVRQLALALVPQLRRFGQMLLPAVPLGSLEQSGSPLGSASPTPTLP